GLHQLPEIDLVVPVSLFTRVRHSVHPPNLLLKGAQKSLKAPSCVFRPPCRLHLPQNKSRRRSAAGGGRNMPFRAGASARPKGVPRRRRDTTARHPQRGDVHGKVRSLFAAAPRATPAGAG